MADWVHSECQSRSSSTSKGPTHGRRRWRSSWSIERALVLRLTFSYTLPAAMKTMPAGRSCDFVVHYQALSFRTCLATKFFLTIEGQGYSDWRSEAEVELNDRFTIGQLSRETGCKVQTIRYYEEIGLMPEPERSSGNQRLYDRTQMDRLAFVRHSRELGFPLEAIRELLSLADDPSRPCEAADAIAQVHLKQIENRLVRLRALKRELERMVKQCKGGTVSDCRVIEVLADHSKCLSDDHRDLSLTQGNRVTRSRKAL